MLRSTSWPLLLVGAIGACSSPSASSDGGTLDGSTLDVQPSDAQAETGDAQDALAPCTTTVEYGGQWIRPANHADDFDVTSGLITWDGTCTADGQNSYALLSNGWKPYFTGPSGCILALDAEPSCNALPASCTTRVSYGAGWIPPANHPTSYDDIPGRVFSDGICNGGTYANLSNGWQPHFSGGICPLSFEYEQCGGLYNNPVIAGDCPDPGVLHDGNQYVLTCTSGDAANAFPIYTSPDLAHWTLVSYVFPAGMHPSWAVSDFWAPEIHHVGSQYVAYFSARGGDGMLAIGAASATSALGPFTDLGAPLIHDSSMGLIDASEINASSPYVLWKEDGNAVNLPTPIHAQELAVDGLSLVGSPATLITNDQTWEGAVTEAPFMVEESGTFYLFYSGNSYATSAYAVGVARGSSPMGPMSKASGPILVTDVAWAGPGHCSVLDTPAGDTAIVYHAWLSGCINGPGCVRSPMLDMIAWASDGWPAVLLAPSSTTRPLL